MLDPAVFQTNYNMLLHATVDGNIAFVRARNKLTNREVMLLCFVNRVKQPPLVIGGQPQLVEHRVPVCEFVLDDAPAIYEPITEDEKAPDNVVPIRPQAPIADTPPVGFGNVKEDPNGPGAA